MNFSRIIQKILILIVSPFLVCILFDTTLNALPIYTNYQKTDILTTKFKIGYLIGNSYVDNYKIDSESKGLNLAIELNPLYTTNITHNFFMGLNLCMLPKEKITSNNILFTLNYYLPLNIITPYWVPKLDLYAGCGYAIRFTKVKDKLDIEDFYINKYGNGVSLGFGAELTYKVLQNYGISYYIDYKFIWFDIKSNIHNNKKYKQYENIFVTIGIVYRSSFFAKVNTINR